MLKVEIKKSQTSVRTRSGQTSQGKPFSFNEQDAYIYLGGDYPVKFSFVLADGQPPYNEGIYELDSTSFFVGNYGRLSVGRTVYLNSINSK